MGNILGCFGGSDNSRKRRKQRNCVVPQEQRHGFQGTTQSTISCTEAHIPNLVSQDTAEEKQSSSIRKRVTFDETVTTYEHVSVKESTETLPEKSEEDPVDDNKPTRSSSSTEDGSVISSVGSYPPNYRYQNCNDSDDEFGESDLDEEEPVLDLTHQIWSESVELDSRKPLEQRGCVRDRSDYVHPVLNPVENLSQWKALKSKAVMALKENMPAEIPVNASLSNWLVSSGTHTAPEKTNSVRSFEDRPILGALTVEELKQLSSSSSSPKKSPSHEDAPIIGSVGTYWNHSGSGTGSSASSFKGIPNTTSKYREDKTVHWHSTPFQTRLDRALKQGAAEA